MVDARAGPGFKLTKPKKVKNMDGKKKSKLKKLHKFKRQSELSSLIPLFVGGVGVDNGCNVECAYHHRE